MRREEHLTPTQVCFRSDVFLCWCGGDWPNGCNYSCVCRIDSQVTNEIAAVKKPVQKGKLHLMLVLNSSGKPQFSSATRRLLLSCCCDIHHQLSSARLSGVVAKPVYSTRVIDQTHFTHIKKNLGKLKNKVTVCFVRHHFSHQFNS